MTIEKFKLKHNHLFNIGACRYSIINNSFFNGEELIIDRYVNNEFVCDRKYIDNAQNDARKMGFKYFAIGTYLRLN